MSVHVAIVDGPVGDPQMRVLMDALGQVGAVVRFEGIVRRMEEGRELAGLDYQAYEPMARQELERLGAETVERHGLLFLRVVHSRGRVMVGECSMVVVIAAAHRAEALRAMGEFIDALKRDIPIWKRQVWAG